jgi:hypothetical protein
MRKKERNIGVYLPKRKREEESQLVCYDFKVSGLLI